MSHRPKHNSQFFHLHCVKLYIRKTALLLDIYDRFHTKCHCISVFRTSLWDGLKPCDIWKQSVGICIWKQLFSRCSSCSSSTMPTAAFSAKWKLHCSCSATERFTLGASNWHRRLDKPKGKKRLPARDKGSGKGAKAARYTLPSSSSATALGNGLFPRSSLKTKTELTRSFSIQTRQSAQGPYTRNATL